jgi:hypothetical protein
MDPLEKVIRPIVEGQIRGFCKEHPSIVDAVDWYKPRNDKATTLVNSLSKRVICDLVCQVNRDRIEDALMEIWERERNSDVEPLTASDGGRAGNLTGEPPHLGCGTIAAADYGPLGTASERAEAGFDDWFGN